MLKKHEIRCSFDTRSEKIGRKIRDAETKKIPYMLIVGEKEAESGMVSVRKHGEGDVGTQEAAAFVSQLYQSIESIFH